MFDRIKFNTIPKFEEFRYWFRLITNDTYEYGLAESFLTSEPQIIGTINAEDNSIPEDLKLEFRKFLTRPESKVGQTVELNTAGATSNDSEYMIDEFETLITGCIFIRYLADGKNPDQSMNAIAKFLNWIRNSDFYTCPGSTRFHDAEPSGLLFHSLIVYNNMLELHQLQKFNSVTYDSIALLALCHDFTKIGNYESYMRNVKNEETGHWEKVPSYRWKGNPFPFGHGVTSMYIVTQFFKLSIEEMLAIRWHMGQYNVCDRESGEMEDAAEQFPLVRMIQFADQLACVKY